MATYGQVIGQKAGAFGQDVISTLLSLSQLGQLPVNAGMSAGQGIGKSLMTEVGQGLNPMEAAGQGVSQAVKKALGPYQKGVESALKKAGESHATEAVMSGVPPEHIEQQSGLAPQQLNQQQLRGSPSAGFANAMGQMPQPAPAQPMTGVATGDETQANPLQTLGNILKTALRSAGEGMIGPEMLLAKNEIMKSDPDYQIGLKKREAEEVPMALSKRQEMRLQSAYDIKKELAKGGSVDALTPENAGKFALLMEGSNATKTISNMLGSNITGQMFAQNIPNFLKSQEGKLLESSIQQAVDAKTRIETGAAMPPDDIKRTVKRYKPREGDTLKTALERLRPLNDFFEGSMNIADPTGQHRQRASGGMNQQALIQAIKAEKQRRGLK